MIRMPSPGPGKGWRATMSSGSPSSRPIAAPHPLNSSRSGSTSLNFRSGGKPPTLWWLLMLAVPAPRRTPRRRGRACLAQEVDVVSVRVAGDHQVPHSTLETPDELPPDDRPFALGLLTPDSASGTSPPRQRSPAGLRWPPRSPVAPVRAPRPQQAVVDEHARQSVADRPLNQCGSHRESTPPDSPQMA